MGKARTGWRARALVALLLLAPATAGASVGPAPAGAAPSQVAGSTPTVTVTPTPVADGGTVTITTDGFPAGLHAFVQCPASYAGKPDTYVLDSCALLSDIADTVPAASHQAVVTKLFTTADGSNTVDCELEPGGCIVGVKVLLLDNTVAEAWAPLEFTGGLSANPVRGLADGDTVTLSAEEVPPGDWSVALCGRDHFDAWDPALTSGRCETAIPVALDGGAFSVDVAAHDPLVTADGTALPCGYDGCVYVLSAAAEPPASVAPVSFGPPSLTIDPPGELAAGQTVEVALWGLPAQEALVRQCALPVAPERCDAGTTAHLDRLGNGTVERPVPDSVEPPGAPALSCLDGSCVLAAFVDDSPVASAPLTFLPPFGLALHPTDGLLDGQTIDVEVVGVPAGSTHTLLRCAGTSYTCEQLGRFTASETGAIDATVPASQRMGDTIYCRDFCRIGLIYQNQLRTVGYAMATGSLTATPANDLTDGQAVQVTGTGLMPTYDGRSIGPFPTGGWVLAQCDAALLDGPSLYAAFDLCTPLSAALVTIEGSTHDTTVHPGAAVTTILGRSVDCTAAPGTCVVGLVRFEQDASLSTHLVPVSFAT